MHLNRSVRQFCAGAWREARQTVGQKWRKHIVYLWRGLNYVGGRAVHHATQRTTLRFSLRTDCWDCISYASKEQTIMSFLRKLSRPADADLTGEPAHDRQLATDYPALHEHLTALVDAEGKRRQTCSLTLYGAQGSFKAYLNDRDAGCSLAVEERSLEGILGALETELEAECPRWRWPDRPKGGSNQKQGRRP